MRVGWSTGFPDKRGMYLVQLSDGECIVTPWEDGKSYSEAEAAYRPRGWACLKDWSGRVIRWALIDDVRAALETSIENETAWLIERNDLGAPHWMMLGPGHRYTTYVPDAGKAHRFARKCDAEAFIRHWECGDPVLRATEHRWMQPHGLQKAERA